MATLVIIRLPTVLGSLSSISTLGFEIVLWLTQYLINKRYVCKFIAMCASLGTIE